MPDNRFIRFEPMTQPTVKKIFETQKDDSFRMFNSWINKRPIYTVRQSKHRNAAGSPMSIGGEQKFDKYQDCNSINGQIENAYHSGTGQLADRKGEKV